MSNDELVNRLVYVLALLAKILLAAVVAGIYAGSMPGFRAGDALAPYGDGIAAALAIAGLALASWIEANRPRFGSEKLARQVNELQKDGVRRADMTVVSTEDIKVLQAEAARLRRIRPLRDVAEADEALERRG